jgi:Zn-dependent peptidase ImmA (M78 family)
VKKILTLDILGFEYKVYSASTKEVPGFDDTDEGYTQADTCTIFINKDVQPCRFRDVLIHEVLHAVFDASGICHLIQVYLPNNSEGNHLMEELMIRALTPALITTFRQIPKVFK